jgi:PAS domain S-box-containing protein
MERRPLNALILEDSEDDALLLVRELGQQGFDVKWERAWTANETKSCLEKGSWDVVLSDYSMGAFDAPAALRLLHESGHDLPFIVISGTIGEEAAVAAMRSGAHDYLMKGSLKRLGPALEREMRDAGIRREHRVAIDKIQHLNRVLSAIRKVNQLIVREQDPTRLIEEACECLVETRGYDASWIALLNDHRETSAVAGRGYKDGWHQISTSLKRGELPGCARKALATSGVVVVDEQLPSCADCVVHQNLGDHKELTVRIENQGRVFGVIAVTLLGGVPTDASEASMLEEVAGDIGFALWSIATEAERLQADEALRQERALLSKIAENYPNSYLSVVDEDLKVIFSAGQEFTKQGLDPKDYDGLTVEQVFGEHAPRVTEHYLRTFRGQESTFELVINNQNQLYKTVPLPDESGQVHRILAVVENITERKRAEEALQRSERDHQRAQEVAHLGHWELDSPEDTPNWSDEIFRIFGIDPPHGSPSFTKHDTIVHPEEWPLLDEAIRGGFEHGQPFDLVFRILRPDSRPGWMHAIGAASRDDTGKVVKMFGTAQDVTESKQQAALLEESEDYLSNIINAIADPVFVKDEHFKFLTANDALCAILGKTRAEIIGTTGMEFLPPDQMDHFLDKDRQVLASGEENTCEEPLTGHDGKIRTIVTKKTRHIDSRGSKFIVGVIRDMTEVKQMQGQLAQSDRLASMGMLAAGVAHEINNPLAYILYNLESLSDDLPKISDSLRRCLGQLDERLGHDEWAKLLGADQEFLNPSMLDDIQARFKDALQGTHRIKDVARGLGTFSRVEQDRLVPVNLMHVIEVALNMVFNEIKFRARLVKDYGKSSSITANDGKLSQVFLNLLINAAHAIPEGDYEENAIRIRTWQEGNEVFAEISDTGKGISPEHLPHLFEPFFTTKEIGTGLGLSISKNIVESYGGRIEVNSKVGEGTSFVVRLPVRTAEDHEIAPRSEETVGQSGAHGRILVVDDEPGIRSAMVRMLKGNEVVAAGSGEEAQKILETDQAFDLILCDMMMPTMSGVDLHEWLVSTYPALARQVVFITGGAFTPKAQEYLKKVDNIRLEKPFDVANFKKIVSELLRNSKRGESKQ